MATPRDRRHRLAHANPSLALHPPSGCWVVPMTAVVQVLPATALTPLPLAPAAVLGLLPWRGQAVPVLHPPGGPPSPPHAAPQATQVVLLHLPAQQSTVGLMVAEVLRHTPADAPRLDIEAWWQNARLGA